MTTGECRPKLEPENHYFARVEHRQWWLSRAAISEIPPAWRTSNGEPSEVHIWCRFDFNGDGIITEVKEMLDTAACPDTAR